MTPATIGKKCVSGTFGAKSSVLVTLSALQEAAVLTEVQARAV